MLGVLLGTLRFAQMAGRALSVVEAASQRLTGDAAVLLIVRVVAGHARHPAVEIAVAERVSLLVRERADPAVGMQRSIAQQWKFQRVVRLQRSAGEKVVAQLVLHGVALIAHTDGGCFVEGRERYETDVGALPQGPARGELHVASAGAVTGLAVDRE